MTTVLLCSGGLDSIVLAYAIAAQDISLVMLAVNYGQRHDKELNYSARCADRLQAMYIEATIQHAEDLFGSPALLDQQTDLPHTEADDPTQRTTIVPNRNVVFLSFAYACAVNQHADTVAIAAHAGDAAIYPDCRPEFIDSYAIMQSQALRGIAEICINAPFLTKTKADIIRLGNELQVPFAKTWSCYAGLQHHCGQCGACQGRRQAFKQAGITDPTTYAK